MAPGNSEAKSAGALTVVAGVVLLAACWAWVFCALFALMLEVSGGRDDSGCYAGHPVWATAQLAVAVVGTAASALCVCSLGSDRTPTRAAWGFAAACSMFCVWLVLVSRVPHAQMIPAC